MSVIIYTAKSMTGRSGDALIREAYFNKGYFEARGITVLDPVLVEDVQAGTDPLNNPLDQLTEYWKRDKEMIRSAHVLLDVTGQSNSEGKAHEIGYARYCLWKPVVRICPRLGPSIAILEDDVIVENVKEAADVILERWGTPALRLEWRTAMLDRCFKKWQQYQLGEFK